jgi:hypothetical protein
MADYTIYNKTTGEIRATVDVPDVAHLLLNTPEGCSAIPGSFSSREYKIVDGQPVPNAGMSADEMRVIAQHVLEVEYREAAIAAFCPIAFTRGGQDRTKMEAAVLAIGQERDSKRAALAAAKTPDDIRALVPTVVHDRRFRK